MTAQLLPGDQLCLDAKIFAEYLPWRILISVKLFIAFLAIFASYFLVKDIGVKWLVHPNAQVLFGNHIFWSSTAPILYVFLYVIDIVRLNIEHENPCDYLVSSSFAVIFRTLHVSCAMAQNFGILALAVERLLSIFMLEYYQRIRRPWIGVGLTFVAILSCLLLPYTVYIFPFLDGPMFSSYTITISHRNIYNQEAAPLSSEFAALLIFHVTFFHSKWYNKRRLMKKTHSISRTYQAVENENVVRPLLYVFWLHFLVCSMQSAATGTFKWFSSGSLTDFAFYLEVFTQFPLYTILLTLLLLPKSCLRRKKSAVVNQIQQQDDYFKGLKTMFNTELERKKRRK